MLETIRTFFTLYWYIIIPVVTTMILAIPVIVYWYSVRYWLMTVRMRLPWVGRIAAWVKNPGDNEQPSPKNPNAVGFNTSERELCGAYQTYYKDHQPSEANYRRNQDYLGKIDEDGRREKGIGLWFLILVLMLVEASAFGFALAPFALTMATPNTAMAVAGLLGLVISILALLLSEAAGRQLYLNSVVSKIMSYENMRNGADMMRTHIVTIDNTHVDDDLPHFQQMLNRVKVPKNGEQPAKRYGLVISYGVFIAVLAVAAFWVRAETLNAQEAALVENPVSYSVPADDFPVSSDDFQLPSGMQELSNSSASKSAQDQIDALHRASLVTFAVLSVLFIFIQVTSTFLAYAFGFAGTHSRKAWELTHKFASAADFVRYHESKARSVAHDAQSSLGKLQSLQMSVFKANGTDRENLRKKMLSRTFMTFIEELEQGKRYEEQQEIIESVGKESRKVIEDYITKTIADLKAAIAADDNAKINRIIEVARPRFDNLKDPALVAYKEQFQGIVEMFGAPAAAAPAPAVVQATVAATPAPVEVAVQVTQPQVEAAPAPAAEPVPAAAPAPAANAAAAPAFDHNAWGDLTVFEADDMEYVAGKKGVDVELIKRARRLQLLDKQGV